MGWRPPGLMSRPSGNDPFRGKALWGSAPRAGKRKTSQEIVAFRVPFPKTTDDLPRFPHALATPAFATGAGVQQQLVAAHPKSKKGA